MGRNLQEESEEGNYPMTNVTTSALIKRTNRKLRKDVEMLHKTRAFSHNVGEYYVIDFYHNILIWTHVNPESLARAIGVLAGTEQVAQ